MAQPTGSITVVSIITNDFIPTAGSSLVTFSPTISAGSTGAVSISSATYNALCAVAFSAAGGSLT